jgi:hypothetical protein
MGLGGSSMVQGSTYNPVLSGRSRRRDAPTRAATLRSDNLPGVRNTDSAVPLHRKAPVIHDCASEGPAFTSNDVWGAVAAAVIVWLSEAVGPARGA